MLIDIRPGTNVRKDVTCFTQRRWACTAAEALGLLQGRQNSRVSDRLAIIANLCHQPRKHFVPHLLASFWWIVEQITEQGCLWCGALAGEAASSVRVMFDMDGLDMFSCQTVRLWKI